MNHLNEEQFEDALAGSTAHAEHLERCDQCRTRLAEHAAVRSRLQGALESAHAPASLMERIRSACGETSRTAASAAGPSGRGPALAFMRAHIKPLAAAAAIVAMAIPLGIYFTGPSSAEAAQGELVEIHRHNLADGEHFTAMDDPAELAGYFKKELGFAPAMPRLNQGMALRGCCVAHFRGHIAGSYVVNTPHGITSIAVVTDEPSTLGLARQSQQGSVTVYSGAKGCCNMSAVRMGDYTYCAIGEVPPETLVKLLSLLVPVK